jgi:hypothetical protein
MREPTNGEGEVSPNPYSPPAIDAAVAFGSPNSVNGELLRTRVWAACGGPLASLAVMIMVAIALYGGGLRPQTALFFLVYIIGSIGLAGLGWQLSRRIGRFRTGDPHALEAIIEQQRRILKFCGVMVAIFLGFTALGVIAGMSRVR